MPGNSPFRETNTVTLSLLRLLSIQGVHCLPFPKPLAQAVSIQLYSFMLLQSVNQITQHVPRSELQILIDKTVIV